MNRKLSKYTIRYIRREVEKWTKDTEIVAFGTPLAGLIDGHLFINYLKAIEKEVK